ncbi:heavy-metal-associated domain-containing protein [Polynucleobacter sp. 30F-ANTBAC]|jgi:copper chaperone CopZ|uniref:heavy-metal-associated domain-containing protein n=1 Tax=Polynucleobacter sp. 30F-ANTBAC TaxID=2689095 RepID=UPI001C0B0688|nr:heavy-metal-associated domain-containing protein [Polynucleobacter sp. 30F-ANTBAC]MBU3600494.1 heavy-metal-associated domain-containing protein [Polynucleobacter sp. 30F-ANTBAC]
MPIFTVNGMNCGHCTKTITEALLEIDPSLHVETDIPNKTVTVTPANSVNVSADMDTLKNTITEAGYEVTAVMP